MIFVEWSLKNMFINVAEIDLRNVRGSCFVLVSKFGLSSVDIVMHLYKIDLYHWSKI